MQAVCFDNFITFFPGISTHKVQQLYMQPFHPQDLLVYFEGWEYYEYYHCYIDHSEERNLVRFEDAYYIINGQRFKYPATLNDFIEDCLETGVRLLWSEAMAEKLWLTQRPNMRD